MTIFQYSSNRNELIDRYRALIHKAESRADRDRLRDERDRKLMELDRQIGH